MSAPKSVVKIKKGNVIYESKVDFACYNIFELTRAAMRDVGKFLAGQMRASARKLPGSQRDRFVRYKTGGIIFKVPFNRDGLPHVEIGTTADSWYTEDHELGTSGQPRRGIIKDTAFKSLAKIIEIESKYLSALEDEAKALGLISEGEYKGGPDD
mgnify:CR=1 FL=1